MQPITSLSHSSHGCSVRLRPPGFPVNRAFLLQGRSDCRLSASAAILQRYTACLSDSANATDEACPTHNCRGSRTSSIGRVLSTILPTRTVSREWDFSDVVFGSASLKYHIMSCHSVIQPPPQYLQSVPESLQALNYLATVVRALVRHPKLQVQEQRNNNNEPRSNHARNNAGNVVRSILSAENCASDDPTDSTSTDECGGAERALPLPANVVRLPCEDAGNVGVRGSSSQEDAEVTVSMLVLVVPWGLW
jgi:hypothetical protein